MTHSVIKHLRRLDKAAARERADVRSRYGDEERKLLAAKTAAIMDGNVAEIERIDGELAVFDERHKRVVQSADIVPSTPTKH